LLRKSPAGRIVNVTTTMGSLTDQTDPESPYYGTVVPAYQASKAALNNVTIALAKALADTTIKVTSVCPGFVQTELTPFNRTHAPLAAADAAELLARAATLPDHAASGTFIDAAGVVPW
jgi:NAD(P)-dependent dehydrogenase (short-subunit alcohol dehydrogenase family)